ncbi:MAG TPA: CBS domain-containing protein [Planctomycetota bacterium]
MDTLAKNLMTRPVRRLTTSSTARDAAAFLLRWGISGAPVEDEHGRWVGVFSLSDLARHVQDRLVKLPTIDPKRERTLETREEIPSGFGFEGFEDTRVGDLMTGGLYSVFPDATLEEIVRSLTVQKIHRLFVISDKGAIEGVITTMDVLRWMDGQFRERRAARHATT